MSEKKRPGHQERLKHGEKIDFLIPENFLKTIDFFQRFNAFSDPRGGFFRHQRKKLHLFMSEI